MVTANWLVSVASIAGKWNEIKKDKNKVTTLAVHLSSYLAALLCSE